MKSHIQTVKMPLEDKNGEALHSAVKYFKIDKVNALIEAGASVGHRDHDKNTPLMTAAMKGYERFVTRKQTLRWLPRLGFGLRFS